MGRSRSALVFFTGLCLAMLIVIDKFVTDGPIKLVANCLIGIGALYQILIRLAPKDAITESINDFIRKFAIGRLLIGEAIGATDLSGEGYLSFKSQLLLFTSEEIKKRQDFIGTNENFTFDFNIKDNFIPGADALNHSRCWEEHLNDQFVFITGHSGSGKTFELIKRVEYMCRKLSPGLSNHQLLEKEKIPIYIELRALDQTIDNEWVSDYLLRTVKSAGYSIKKTQLDQLIEFKEVVFFFDGVDEIQPAFRKKTIDYILSKKPLKGVHFTCRTQIYRSLLQNGTIPEGDRPAEYPLLPLDLDRIKAVIMSLTDRPSEAIGDMIKLIENKPGLVTYLSRPIFLNLFILVYGNLSEEEKLKLASAQEESATDLLWENYEDIIYQKKLDKNSDKLGIRTITVWLAKIMKERAFFVESIQPEWLSDIDDHGNVITYKFLQRLYIFSTRVFASAVIGIALGCIVSTPFALLSDSILGGVLITLIAGVANRFSRRFWESFFGKMAFTLTMVILLIICCGSFQGLLLPRAPGDMLTPYFSVVECWPGVLMGLTLSTIFSYRIIMENARKQYILPIELFHFDWRHAIQYGLTWGVISGIITGGIALYVKNQFKQHLFIREWLIPYLSQVLRRFNSIPLTVKNLDIAVFVYAFLLTFFVASIIIILLAGRYNDEPELNIQNKQKLNYGIKKSAKHAFSHALNVAVLALIVYYLIMFRFGIGNIYFGLKISLGITLLAFLWFGGMEVTNHWLLRVNLYMRGIAPINYSEWVAAQQRMGLIIPSGYKMSFYHNSLAAYYTRYPVVDNPRIRITRKVTKDIWAYCGVVVILTLIMVFPFIRRYGTNTLWRTPYEVKATVKNIHALSISVFEVEKPGVYTVDCSGKVNVGTFVGYVCPSGTQYGFMGMPINDPYDIDTLRKFRHAELLYRLKHESQAWSAYNSLKMVKTIKLDKGDQLQFLTNDKEWQNNLGRYTVSILPCDTCNK